MIIRSLPQHKNSIFLTFDDGPDPLSTPAVLDVLLQHKVLATFFVVTDKAQVHPELLFRMRKEGHSIGNHSPDHRYRNFFRSEVHLTEWFERAEKQMHHLGILNSVGFRPPAGIVTPALKRLLVQRNEPLVLWNERFYDAVIPWGSRRARNSARRLAPGSIVLLHDRQNMNRLPKFVTVLKEFITEIKLRDLQFLPLKREDLF